MIHSATHAEFFICPHVMHAVRIIQYLTSIHVATKGMKAENIGPT
jgi:hypothetical protein